jgi:hypothetical protein
MGSNDLELFFSRLHSKENQRENNAMMHLLATFLLSSSNSITKAKKLFKSFQNIDD